MRGDDALDLLQRLSTQDLHALQPGEGAGTVLTSPKGRIIDLLGVLRFEEHLLLLTSPGRQSEVMEWIDRYTIIEDSELEDITERTHLFGLIGPRAREIAVTAVEEAQTPEPGHHVAALVAGQRVSLVRPGPLGADGLFVLVEEASDPEAVRGALLDAGAEAVSPEAYEALRVEMGQPAYGKELDERFNPLEAELRDFISFAKGCYIGQEVVARLDTYDKVQRRLMGLMPQGDAPEPGARLEVDGKEAGTVTSVVYSPGLGRQIALGYVRKRHAEPGTRLTVTGGGESEVEVAELPFL
jgi:folate-binding protein YgfZ